MRSATGLAAILLAILADVLMPVAPASAQLAGEWYVKGELFGLLLKGGGMNPSRFIHGICDKPLGKATVMFEMDPKLFAGAIGSGDYILIRSGAASDRMDLQVTRIDLNEPGVYAWAPVAMADARILEFWARPSRLELTLGVEHDRAFKGIAKFVLPDNNRREAITAFKETCFSPPH